jgi:hypothetical protein
MGCSYRTFREKLVGRSQRRYFTVERRSIRFKKSTPQVIDEETLYKPCWWRLRRSSNGGGSHEIEARCGVGRRIVITICGHGAGRHYCTV